MNTPVTLKQSKSMAKMNKQTNKLYRTQISIVSSSQLFQTFKEITPILQDFFQMMEKEIPLTHFQDNLLRK